MGLRQTFGTDKDMESKGVVVQPDPDTRTTLLRAGSTNPKYALAFKRHSEPFQRAIENGTLDRKTDTEILAKVYAEGVITLWETRDRETGEWKTGIEAEDGGLLPYNLDNVVAILLELPDLFEFLREKAERLATFQNREVKEDAKN